MQALTRHRHLAWVLGALLLALGAPASAQTPAPEVWAQDMREAVQRTPVTVADMFGREETRQLPITVFRPAGDGPHPLVVFNHGRAVAGKRATQGRARYEHAVRYLVGKGFVVMVPTRIGYWETYGDFDPEQSGTCRQRNLAPVHRAVSEQVLATVAHARTLAYVDASRWIVAGQSVGGLTALATVSRQPPSTFQGVAVATQMPTPAVLAAPRPWSGIGQPLPKPPKCPCCGSTGAATCTGAMKCLSSGTKPGWAVVGGPSFTSSRPSKATATWAWTATWTIGCRW